MASVTFFYPSTVVGGTEYLFLRLAKALLAQGHTVHYGDFEGGFLDKALTGSGAHRLVYDRNQPLQMPENTVIVMPSMLHVGVSNLQIPTNSRVLLYILDRFSFVMRFPGMRWDHSSTMQHLRMQFQALDMQRYNLIRSTLKTMTDHQGLIFLSEFSAQQNMALFALPEENAPAMVCPNACSPTTQPDFLTASRERCEPGIVNLGWLGRLAEGKVYPAQFVIENASRWAEENRQAVRLHLIGEGPGQPQLAGIPTSDLLDVRFVGTLEQPDLDRYLNSNVDCLFAMGTSLLESAKIKLPSIVLETTYTPMPLQTPMAYLHEAHGGILGDFLGQSPIAAAHSFDDVMTALVTPGEKARLGQACFDYYQDNHSMAATTERFLAHVEACNFTAELFVQNNLFNAYAYNPNALRKGVEPNPYIIDTEFSPSEAFMSWFQENRHEPAVEAFMTGLQALQQNDIPTARSAFHTMGDALNDWAISHFYRGILDFHLGHFQRAIAYFKTVVGKQEAVDKAMLNISRCYGRMDSIPLSLRWALKAYHHQPNNPVVCDYLGQFYFKFGKTNQAFFFQEQLFQLAPNHPGVLKQLGDTLAAIGQVDDAADCYATAIERNPNNLTPWIQLANAYRCHGRWADTEEIYEKLLSKSIAEISAQKALRNDFLALNYLQKVVPTLTAPKSWQSPNGNLDILFFSINTLTENGGGHLPPQVARSLSALGHRVVFAQSYHYVETNNQAEPFVVVDDPFIFQSHGATSFQKQWWQGITNKCFPAVASPLNQAPRQKVVVIGALTPYLCSLVPFFQAQGYQVVYWCIDDWQGLGGDGFPIIRETALVNTVDTLVATSQDLVNKLEDLSQYTTPKPCALIPNGFSTANFPETRTRDNTPCPEDLLRGDEKTIIYWGGIIHHWIDWTLMLALVDRHPEWSFNFIGPNIEAGRSHPDVEELSLRANVRFLGSRKVSELQAYGLWADAGIIHFKVNPLTSAVNPVKAYEYLACGLPIVSTPMPELNKFPNTVQANGVDAFDAALMKALQTPPNLSASRAFLAQNSWQSRADQFCQWVRQTRPLQWVSGNNATVPKVPTPANGIQAALISSDATDDSWEALAPGANPALVNLQAMAMTMVDQIDQAAQRM